LLEIGNDPETLLITLKFGAGVALAAAVLYFCTSSGERSGFRVFPSTPREWTHWWFRTLIVTLLGAVGPLLLSSYAPFTAAGGLLIVSTLLLFVSSVVFWKSDRGFCIAGLTLSVISVLCLLLFPVVH